MHKIVNFEKYFWGKVKVTSYCWHWLGGHDGCGYGQIKLNKVVYKVHRVAYELLAGKIPEGMELDHLCHTYSDCSGGISCKHRLCVNPYHLEPVPKRVNILRGNGMGAIWARRTHCHRCGSSEWIPRSDGGRRCKPCLRECNRIRNARARAKKKLAEV